MSKSKEFYYPLEDDVPEQLELVIVEHKSSIDINVFDTSIFNVQLPPIVNVVNKIHNIN